MARLTVLVSGATGKQGGSVAAALLAHGHTVRALTRKPDSVAAAKLKKAGAQVVAGDLADETAVEAAAQGVDAVYLMGNAWEAGADRERETGLKALNALTRTNVGHVIYSSVDSADRNTGVPHFESKFAVERRLVTSGLPYTISAPASFMDNLAAPWTVPGLQKGAFALALPPARKLKQIAVTDIGAFVSALVERRERVFGRRFDIAGDECDGPDMARILSRAIGREIRHNELSLDVVRQQSQDAASMYAWFDRVGYAADIPALKSEFPEVRWHGLAEWAADVDWNALLQPSNQPALAG
jgi:uncharacterized protein YbjT (DUF2867 family)